VTPVVVLGPTASGKSAVAMALALELAPLGGAEIVAVDAMQVYRGMDIGTAKPTAADRAAVVHHGLDLAEPSAEVTVASYVAAVGPTVAALTDGPTRPVLVGGTGLYLRALTDPMEMPGQWPELRASLESRLAAEGPDALHAELASLDPVAAGRMEPSNGRRVVRALEVCLGSGRRFSSFGPGLDQYPPIPWRMLGLRWPRPVLAERIRGRVHQMVADGLVHEVAGLLARPGGLSRTAAQALGYKELIDHVEGRVGLEEAVDDVVLRTRQFAVRQERWFRRDPRITWLDVGENPVVEAMPLLRDWCER
jgi:tRNA dimethylallyltransferase